MAISTPIARAVYAADPAKSRGRLLPEPPSASRNDFRRDCDRIIHSAAFRRLAHKTQVFVYHEGDHFRTRLTHTLEVVQIARSLARALGLDEDLAEAAALAHDLGHPPFGHAGERALDACLEGFGGFDHNAQALRIVTSLERRYAQFDGLNLTWETLEGLVKHNGPLIDARRQADRALCRHAACRRRSWPTRACRISSCGLTPARRRRRRRSPTTSPMTPTTSTTACAPICSPWTTSPGAGGRRHRARDRWRSRLDASRRAHETVRRIITRMIEDVMAESGRRIGALKPRSYGDVRNAASAVVAFSPAFVKADADIKGFLYPRMYRHARVMAVMNDAEGVVRDLFGHYAANPADLPAEWHEGLDASDAAARARRVGDYIAGMTDRYALIEHAKYFKATPELR